MALSPTQLTALKADIEGDATLNAFPNTSDGNDAIRVAYAAAAIPDFWIWITSVHLDEIASDPGFNWARVDNLSIGKARIWEWMFRNDEINASQANVRAGIDSTWVGTQADLDVRAAIYAKCRRLANRGEKLLATGTGSTASPATMGFEGEFSTDEIQQARNLP